MHGLDHVVDQRAKPACLDIGDFEVGGFHPQDGVPEPGQTTVVALDEALTELAGVDESLARIVDLRFFGGLDHDEIAALLGVSNPTVRRRWRVARAWLYRHLSNGEALPDGG